MADERLDDLDRRLRELEARVAGLSAEQETLRDAVVAVGGPFGTDDQAAPSGGNVAASSSASDTAASETATAADSWTDPALRTRDSEARGETSDAVEGDDGAGNEPDERDIVMAPPKGASQAAEQAVDEVERTHDREENLVM